MPWTIYRYILREVLKLFVLATTVLVIVLAVAAAIKPISDGLLGPVGVLRFVAYLCPVMLMVAAPFSAAFASTLVFCRLATDNEILALSAGGFSYRAILMPLVALGLALTLGLWLLSNWVLPDMYSRAKQMVEHDLMRLIVSEIQSGRPVDDLPATGDRRHVLYADDAEEMAPTEEMLDRLGNPELPPSRLVVVEGLALGELDPEGRIRGELTAERAAIFMFQRYEETWLTMRLQNVVYYDPMTGNLQDEMGSKMEDVPLGPIYLPSPFRDDPKLMSYSRLRELNRRPDLFDRVRKRKDALAEEIAKTKILGWLEAGLDPTRGRGRVRLLGPRDLEYRVTTPRVERHDQDLMLVRGPMTPVEVEVFREGLIERRFEAERVNVEIERPRQLRLGAGPGEPRLVLEMENVTVYNEASDTPSTSKPTHELRGRWPEVMLDSLQDRTTGELLTEARRMLQTVDHPGEIRADATALAQERRELHAQIEGEIHERAASAISAGLVLLLGAVLSMKLRLRLPLVVYFWSFLLAIGAIIITMSGERIIEGVGNLPVGLLFTWSGNVMLIAAIVIIHWKLAKN